MTRINTDAIKAFFHNREKMESATRIWAAVTIGLAGITLLFCGLTHLGFTHPRTVLVSSCTIPVGLIATSIFNANIPKQVAAKTLN